MELFGYIYVSFQRACIFHCWKKLAQYTESAQATWRYFVQQCWTNYLNQRKLNFNISDLMPHVMAVRTSHPAIDACSYPISFAALILVLTAIFISEVGLASLKSVWSSTLPQDSAQSSSNRGPARRTSLNGKLTSWMLFIILVSSDYKTRLTSQDR